MADNHSQKSRTRYAQAEPSYDVYDEDPLVELARIVSEDGGYSNISGQQQSHILPEPEPGPEPEFDIGYEAETDIGVDLESQLMEELELSMASPDGSAYGDGYPPEAYLPEEPEGIVYADEHAYAPEDSAALAQMSSASVERPAEPGAIDTEEFFGDKTEFSPAYVDGPETSVEADIVLSAEDLSGLEQTLSSDGYPPNDEYGLAGEFPDLVAREDNWAEEMPDEGVDDDGMTYAVPPVFPVEGEFADRNIPREGRSGRKLFAVAAVLSIAVLGGGVVAMMSSTSNNMSSGTPPVFKADTGPMKVAPDGKNATDDGGQTAFDVAVNPDEPVREELIDRTEKPVDRVIALENKPQTDVLRTVGNADEKDVARISAESAASAIAPKYEPIGPKTVTTLKVNADGMIIRSTLDENNVGLQNNTESTIMGGLPTSVNGSDPIGAPAAEPKPVPVNVVDIKTNPEINTGDRTSPLTDVIAGLPADQADVAAETATVGLPRSRPAGAPAVAAIAAPATRQLVAQPAQATQSGAAPVNLLETARKTAPQSATPVSTGSTNSSGYVVQLSSQRSEEQALAAFNGLKKRFPSLLGNYEANIQRADLGDRGVYYRVRVGPMADQAGAQQFCSQLQSSGGSCFVTR